MRQRGDIGDPVKALRSEYERLGLLNPERLKVLERLEGDSRMPDVWRKFSLNLQDDIPSEAAGFVLSQIATGVVNTYEIINDRDRLLEQNKVTEQESRSHANNARSLCKYIQKVVMFQSEDMERFRSSDRAITAITGFNDRALRLTSDLEWIANEIESRIPSYNEYLNPFPKSQKGKGPTGLALMLSRLVAGYLKTPMHAQIAIITDVLFPGTEVSAEAVRKAVSRERRRSE